MKDKSIDIIEFLLNYGSKIQNLESTLLTIDVSNIKEDSVLIKFIDESIIKYDSSFECLTGVVRYEKRIEAIEKLQNSLKTIRRKPWYKGDEINSIFEKLQSFKFLYINPYILANPLEFKMEDIPKISVRKLDEKEIEILYNWAYLSKKKKEEIMKGKNDFFDDTLDSKNVEPEIIIPEIIELKKVKTDSADTENFKRDFIDVDDIEIDKNGFQIEGISGEQSEDPNEDNKLREKAETKRKPLKIITNNKQLVWRKIGAIATGLLVGVPVAMMPPIIGDFIRGGLILGGGIAKVIIKKKIKKLELARLEQEGKTDKIENPDEEVLTRVERFKKYIKSEDGLKDINHAITVAIVSSSLGFAQGVSNIFEISGENFAENVAERAAENIGESAFENTADIVANVEVPVDTIDFSVGDVIDGQDHPIIYDTASMAAENVNPETTIAEYVSADNGSHIEQLYGFTEDGTQLIAEEGQSALEFYNQNPEIEKIVADVEIGDGVAYPTGMGPGQGSIDLTDLVIQDQGPRMGR